FTHRGLSGPAVLQISNYWQPGDEVVINLLPDIDLTETIKQWQKERPKTELKNLIGELLTRRVAHRWMELWHHNKPVNQYNEKEINEVSDIFHAWSFRPSDTEGYRVAEVTRGGVDTNELSSKTFEARKVKGLYFIGEVVDVTGWLGGYNLQWAWSSGFSAGQFV
ncbi:MAG TPA: NAD(P)/FAD-dependent oxidoreductase, partial [Candidatus Scalindua sp.]|nr:NAD(P)/FAD-dependent oxidoreductase [Candidatus Scalindua sp.]